MTAPITTKLGFNFLGPSSPYRLSFAGMAYNDFFLHFDKKYEPFVAKL
jgi:hypothetical protein